MDVSSDRTIRFDAAPVAVWDAIGRVEEYRRWWPWLSHFEARGLIEGDRWLCTVKPPLPYEVTFTIILLEVDRPEQVAASVAGDITGPARIALRPTERGCQLRLTSTLQARSRTLQGMTRFVPWFARYGHDWVIDRGLRQFRQQAL